MIFGALPVVGARHLLGAPPGKLLGIVLAASGAAVIALPLLYDTAAVAVTTVIVVVLASITMIGIGVRRYRPPVPWAWYSLGASALLFAVGALLRDDFGGGAHPLDDIATLAGYAGVGVAAFLWLRPRRGQSCTPDQILDSGLIGLGALLASWTFLISPVLHHAHGPTGALLFGAAYPVLDALLLTLVTHSVVASSRSEISLRLVHASLLAILVADLGHGLSTAGTLRLDRELLTVPMLLAYALLGLAALHPTMVTLGRPRRVVAQRSRRRASVIAVALVVASLVPTVGERLGSIDRLVVSSLLAVLLIGVLVRSERAIVRSARSERRAQYQADHDMLTGLLNRSALLRTPARNREHWSGRPLCMLFLDLDGFKAINDTHGHTVGDELIANAAARIRRIIPREDVAARYGGDEFVVLAAADRAAAAVLAERLLAAFATPFELSVGEVSIGASIGIACGGPRAADPTVYDLLREADSAMYHAKAYGLGYAFGDDVPHRGPADAGRRGWRRETAV
ncbi:GGDEF domain-containing protein [Nocardia sp. CDC159]|uniref:GGDEF domain-containing protein n=1 Tax=Nocardia pulmonis TaxID=2951408 RepID=A0A9X2J172_9NOCA|nr:MULTISPECIES: GGDEF domain-containing protein [Nocardia]MCM6778599.1 GGDEF domain-containing protein [Nocardia pulmonis]MCM6791488.1 GGDEF domain-containing protein [Nocardia sp. CDC159]